MKKCLRPVNHCEFQQFTQTKEAMCTIKGVHYKCLDEEEYMANIIDIKEAKKKRGEKEIEKINAMVKELAEYLDICPDPNALDRVSDAALHLRKARMHLMTHYGIDFNV